MFSHPVYLFLRKFSLQDSRGGSGYYSDRIAFPIEDDINPDDLVGYWNYFCKHLNITYSGRIPLPLEDESGQMGFGI
ncbi:hypothetical protein AWE57_24080 [Escherichia coli]|nr:hypothetical protein AWE57_24080 [Escherichia coli]